MTGGTGAVGRVLAEALTARGDDVLVVSRGVRSGPEAQEFVPGNPTMIGDWMDRALGCDAVIHLAGAPVVRYVWNDRVRKQIVSSRVDSANNLVAAIAQTPPERRPRAFLCASSTDYYDFDASDTRVAESAPFGEHFLGSVARSVETAAEKASALGVQVSTLRMGHVIGTDRESFSRYTGPFSLFFHGPIGTGEQWFSWIHIQDVVGACLWILDQKLSGPFNLVAPAESRQGDFSRMVAACLRRQPQPMTVPKIMSAFREMGEVVVQGRRASPVALVASGFRFRLPDAPSALAASLTPS
jgi:uncharacterized protein (TIGR01777 family)